MFNKNKKPFQKRQGDVFIEKAEIPEGCKPVPRDNGRAILAYGEVTGHAHAIADEKVELVEKDGVLYMKVTDEVKLKHEEHDTQIIPAGDYKITHQREYHPDSVRRVLD